MTRNPRPAAGSGRSCVLLFAREPGEEARRKHIPNAAPLFDLAARSLAASVDRLPGVDLLVFRPGAPAHEPGPQPRPGDGDAPRSLPQRGAGFGERLSNAFDDARALGYERIVAVGCDSPGLSAAHLSAALRALEAAPIVVGPAADGGVYLLGAMAGARLRFDGIPWRTRRMRGRFLCLHSEAVVLDAVLDDLDRELDLRRLRERILLRSPEARELETAFAALVLALFAPNLPATPAAHRAPHSLFPGLSKAPRAPPAPRFVPVIDQRA